MIAGDGAGDDDLRGRGRPGHHLDGSGGRGGESGFGRDGRRRSNGLDRAGSDRRVYRRVLDARGLLGLWRVLVLRGVLRPATSTYTKGGSQRLLLRR